MSYAPALASTATLARLTKAAALAGLVLALLGGTACDNGSLTSPVPVRALPAEAAAEISTLVLPSSSAIMPRLALQRALDEVAIARRLLGVVRDDLDDPSSRYLAALDNALDFARTNEERLPEIAAILASRLAAARTELLDAAPSARRWTRLASAVSPDTTPHLPRRFVRPRQALTAQDDARDLLAAAWVRSLKA